MKNIPNKLLTLAFASLLVTFQAHAALIMPQLFITRLVNKSSYNLVIVDRLAGNKEIIVAQGKSLNTALSCTKDKVRIFGSMRDCMAQSAQYIIKKQGSPASEQVFFLNMNISEGGINDGSGIISGEAGTLVLTFMSAGSEAGCVFASSVIKELKSHVETTLTFTDKINDKGLFAVDIDYALGSH